jgi:hypothetical protein
MEEVEAVIARAVAQAESIVQRTTDPYRGAKELWMLEAELASLVEDLRAFVGLASEWEDDAAHRKAYERDIYAAADRFRARYGN